MDRLDLYLQWNMDKDSSYYVNTEEETERVNKFQALYSIAKSAQESNDKCSPANLVKWRKAYEGTLGTLNKDGTERSDKQGRQPRKLIYELVESKIDNSIPMPKIMPRYKSDLFLVDNTESFLKFEMDRILTRYVNDSSERATYVDGTCWYKVWWDSLDNTHERSGDLKIELCLVDQIVPQPGVTDYRQLEYIFERKQVSTTRLYDLYGRLIMPTNSSTNMTDIVSCYYLNENRIVGLFVWNPASMQVICDEKDWQIRKLRTCTKCGAIVPQGETCGNCGSKTFKYKNASIDILDEDIDEIYNPYEVGETDDDTQKDMYAARVFATKGTEIPFYTLHQLPFVPRPNVSSIDSIYGKSDAMVLLEEQDLANKVLTKAVDKTLKSGAVITKPDKLKLGDKDDTFKVLGVRTAEESTMVQAKQIVADTSQDILIASMLYDMGKSTSGITDSFQGKKDTTATSGKAKEYSAAQSAGRIESTRVMKAAAFAGLYELMLKYLLAFSDEPRKYVKILPNGKEKEMTWNKYMFLEKDKYGQYYYRDDFEFSTDPAATLSQNRVSMWQETQEKFLQGAFGNPADPRTLELFWNMMDSYQYPLAKTVLSGVRDNASHLPAEVEQAILQNPELYQSIMQWYKKVRLGKVVQELTQDVKRVAIHTPHR